MEKKIEGYLIVNWKTREARFAKRKPADSKLSPFQIVITLDLDIVIPEKREMIAKGKIQVSETKATQIILESI